MSESSNTTSNNNNGELSLNISSQMETTQSTQNDNSFNNTSLNNTATETTTTTTTTPPTNGDSQNTKVESEQQQQDNNNNKDSNSKQDRKRKHDGENNQSQKRINSDNSSSNENDVYFKLLIPSSLAGSVIGRGGERIAQIQKDANVRIKMSKATEHYPNTNERVCLIIGSVRSVLKAHELIVEKIQEKPESSKQHESDLYERVNIIKLLVPNSTAGLIIGKAGVFIKQIKDDSGAFVQISTKQTDLPERIVSIEGDAEKRNKALSLVLKKIADDPLHNTVPTLNYSTLLQSSSNSSNQNSDQFISGSNSSSMGGGQQLQQQQNQQSKFDFNSIANYLAGLNNLALLIINCGGSFQMTADSLKNALRNAGYNTSASMEIIDAITVLLSYGLITKTSPAALLASNPSIAGLGNMANLTSVLAASMVSTMANMASNNNNANLNNSNSSNSNSNNNKNNNSYGGGHHGGHHHNNNYHSSGGGSGGNGNGNGSQYYHGHMNGGNHNQNGHHHSGKR